VADYESATPQLTLDLATGTPDSTAHPASVCFGTTESGVELAIKSKITDIKADQFDAPIDAYLDSVDAELSATLSQQSVDLLQQAFPEGVYSTLAGPPGYKQLTGGGIGIVPTVCVAAITPKRTGTNLWIVSILFRVSSQGGITVTSSRAKKSTHKVMFKGQSDITRTAGRQIFNHYETL
jgi:hypothetical protein